MFANTAGTPWSNDNFRRDSNWRKATAEVGLEGFRIHDLRHAAASLMISQEQLWSTRPPYLAVRRVTRR